MNGPGARRLTGVHRPIAVLQGLLLAGTMVDNMVPGGPADLSDMLEKGDTILSVDGYPVTPETVWFVDASCFVLCVVLIGRL